MTRKDMLPMLLAIAILGSPQLAFGAGGEAEGEVQAAPVEEEHRV